MSELSDILKEEYTKKQGVYNVRTLMEMVEEILEFPLNSLKERKKESKRAEKLTIDLIPTLPITEIGWGSLTTPDGEGKEVRTAAGQDLAQFLNNIAPGGDLRAKIEALDEYYQNPDPTVQGDTPGQQISAVISNLVFYKTLTNRIISV